MEGQGPTAEENALPGWSDRVELRSLVDNYARGVDDRDVSLFVSVFADDAWLEIYKPGTSAGEDSPSSRYQGSAELATIMGLLDDFGETMHLMANHQLEFNETGGASGITTCLAHHLTKDEQTSDLVMYIRYYDTYRNTDEGWRIQTRIVDWLWSELRPIAAVG